MTPTPEQLALAREIYWQYLERLAAERGIELVLGKKEKILRGDCDAEHGVQIAIATLASNEGGVR